MRWQGQFENASAVHTASIQDPMRVWYIWWHTLALQVDYCIAFGWRIWLQFLVITMAQRDHCRELLVFWCFGVYKITAMIAKYCWMSLDNCL
ncbi:hypothetical protein O0I10_012904 [Lichtheimia ornata]|uniref:Uncharacterized protein n=1 Tax=Lichtheimia ornata TaxID=688661 RepID=A0AAD7USC4_9FUNG|nr:uncharacterized protein O0I10_012904 [Lichtheimia ornata]KAJ8651540.1 hypothetical protein O0I10_012904 [Lichtheimia ornata]